MVCDWRQRRDPTWRWQNQDPAVQPTKTMADMRFTCSHCGQEIECDELWSGHQIQCPTCQTELTVPPKPDAPPHATLASATPGQSRLSIGQSRIQRSAAPPPPPPQMPDAATAVESGQARQEGQRHEVGDHQRRGGGLGRGRLLRLPATSVIGWPSGPRPPS